MPVIMAMAPQAADPTHEDALLVERVAAGDTRALRELYDRYAGRSLALALRVLGSRAEAEEVVQDAFVELWRRAGQFERERGAARGFLTTIVRSRAIDRLRSRGVHERTAQDASREPVPTGPSPIEAADARLERERVSQALAALPEAQRQVIELAYYEGRSQREIAALTGEPLGTIKTRVRLALDKLTSLLGGKS
jgi:RNA polymerase sigma-70 factor (ECF subfamily)